MITKPTVEHTTSYIHSITSSCSLRSCATISRYTDTVQIGQPNKASKQVAFNE